MCLFKVGEKAILQLNSKGFEAYFVGGCVRDMFLHTAPKDIDITTNATVEQIKEVFRKEKLVLTGAKYGTVTVYLENIPIEITTYRVEKNYSDFRHPNDVIFTSNLLEDLKRRDFTIGAIAFDGNKNIIDPFNGQADLKKKIIRAVGDPNLRFQEDPLRILRAIRFCCQLGFSIEEDTKNAISENIILLNKISKERIQNEFNLMLLSNNFSNNFQIYYRVFTCFLPLLKYAPLQKISDSLKAFDYIKQNLTLRLALLFFDFEATLVKENLHSLHYSNKQIKQVFDVLNYKKIDLKNNKVALKKQLNEVGTATLQNLVELKLSLAKTRGSTKQIALLEQIQAQIIDIIQNNDCYQINQLQINGTDLITSVGLKEKEIGNCLKLLLDLVINNTLANEKEILLYWAKKKYKK